MPAIQIKESPVYNMGPNSSAYGSACKFLVEQLVGLDPTLSIAEVVSDTTSNYCALVRVANSSVGFKIQNSGSYLYIDHGAWKSNGSFMSIFSVSVSSFFPATASGTQVKVSLVGVDGTLKYAVFKSSYTVTSGYLTYGMFTSDIYEYPIYAVQASTCSGPEWPVQGTIPVCATPPCYWYNPDLDIVEIINYVSSGSVATWAKAGYLYGLMPTAYCAYSETKGFGNIKWGGAYDLYVLYDSTKNIARAHFGETVSINGVSTLSGGTVALIL